jgi:hypothetical protein
VEQYDKLVQDDNFIMTWVCKNCQNLKVDKDETKSEHFDEIIKILMEDIKDLKSEIDLLKSENTRLSEVIAKKMQVIYKLETLIYSSVKPSELDFFKWYGERRS